MTARYPGPDVSSAGRQEQSSGLSIGTLVVTSLSSLAAALVVSRFWGAGTLIGAALTPIIVALVSEGLHRPARVVSHARVTRTGRFDPVAEGRAGVREGDLSRARPARPGDTAGRPDAEPAGGASPRGPGSRPPSARGPQRPARSSSFQWPRKRVALAVVTGLIGFAIAGVMLTGTELVFGDSVAAPAKRTTLFGGSDSRTSTDEEKTETTTTTVTTETTAPTETAPETQPTEPTVPTTTGAVPPPEATPAPTTPPATPPATTAPPATPPATTTP